MSFKVRCSTVLAALLLSLAAGLAGCGKKGDPQPPIRLVPKAATDLVVSQRGTALELAVSYPAVATNGLALPPLAAVEVWRAERPLPEAGAGDEPTGEGEAGADGAAEQAQPEAVPDKAEGEGERDAGEGDDTGQEPAGEAAESGEPQPPEPPEGPALPRLDKRQLEAAGELTQRFGTEEVEAAVVGDRLLFRLSLPEIGEPPASEHSFAVRFVTVQDERSELSNVVAIVPRTPPEPPGSLSAEETEQGVLIRWEDGEEELVGYHVYRRGAQERAYGKPRILVPADREPQFLDRKARFGERYFYGVTAVAQLRPTVESAFGAEREVEYLDRFPPPPPEGLVALAEAGQVRLSWQASTADDIAGYYVYRRDLTAGEETAFERLARSPVAATRFLDASLATGSRFAYRVTAVDAEGNEGPPGAAVEALVR